MFATIWIALALFAVGELAFRTPRSLPPAARSPIRRLQPVARSLFFLGALLCAIHMLIAMAAVHGWSHAAAIAATAGQTEAVFGVRSGSGIYVNYLFVAVWIVDAIARLRAVGSVARRPRALVWTLRAFYFVIIVNAAVIFAAPERRWLGGIVIVTLVIAWFPRSRAHMKDMEE